MKYEAKERNIRLNKAIAQHGFTSRRKADELIKSGKVKVNGKRTFDLSTQVSKNDKIEVNGKLLKAKQHQYILFYKPSNCITTRADEQDRKTIYHLLPRSFYQLKPVGRLDRNTEGLLLLTNDGDFINFVLHPKNKIKKYYEAKVNGTLTSSDIAMIKKRFIGGIKLDNTVCKADRVEQLKTKKDQTSFLVVIHQGVHRQIRRMFEEIGYSVKSLVRTQIGSLSIKGLQKGEFVELNKEEISKVREV